MIKPPTQTPSVPKCNVEQMPNGEDPWKHWIASHNGTGLSSSSIAKLSVSTLGGSAQGRRIEAPIEDRFEKQSAELQDMREKFQ